MDGVDKAAGMDMTGRVGVERTAGIQGIEGRVGVKRTARIEGMVRVNETGGLYTTNA